MSAARAATVPPTSAETWVIPGADALPLRLYSWRQNTGDRPALIWGHANGFSTGAYAPILDELATLFDIYGADLRCHGGSADPGGDYDHVMSADRFALDLIAVAAAVRQRTPYQQMHFAGHSLSGIGVLRAGAVFGCSPFVSVTLFEPPLAPTPDHPLHGGAAMLGHVLAGRALKRRQVLPDPESFAASLAERDAFARWRPDMLHTFVHATLIPAEDGDGWRLRCAPEAEAAGYRMTMDTSTFAALRDFARPILFVESDPEIQGVAPSWATKAQGVAAKQAPQGRLQRIAKTSHMMPFERPEAIIEIIAAEITHS
jgi:pimeloyl-ACP methyl ester carboxylesterase